MIFCEPLATIITPYAFLFLIVIVLVIVLVIVIVQSVFLSKNSVIFSL